MSQRRLKAGETVQIVDYFRAMRTCINRDRGDGVLYGAGGCVLPSGILETPATVFTLSTKSHRALITWNHEQHSMWIDCDNLQRVAR